MMFSFKSSARKDLVRSLTKAGAPQVSQAVSEIEGLVQQYHSRFIAKRVFPDMKFRGEAQQLLALADAVCWALDEISPPTRIRLEEERVERDEELSLDEYAQSVNDVCMFAVHAMGDGDRPLKVAESAADRALCRLAADLATVWRKHTGAELPNLPRVKSPPETSWRGIRQLQQNPMWIVFDALGIFVDADTMKLNAKLSSSGTSKGSLELGMPQHAVAIFKFGEDDPEDVADELTVPPKPGDTRH